MQLPKGYRSPEFVAVSVSILGTAPADYTEFADEMAGMAQDLRAL